MEHEVFISEHPDGWYVYDPNVRAEGFGPLTFEEAEGVKHMRRTMQRAGKHSFTSCPPNSRAMCSFAEDIKSALNKIQELRWLCD